MVVAVLSESAEKKWQYYPILAYSGVITGSTGIKEDFSSRCSLADKPCCSGNQDSCSAVVVCCTSRLISDDCCFRSTRLFARCGRPLTRDTHTCGCLHDHRQSWDYCRSRLSGGAHLPRCQLISIPWPHALISYNPLQSLWCSVYTNSLCRDKHSNWNSIIVELGSPLPLLWDGESCRFSIQSELMMQGHIQL